MLLIPWAPLLSCQYLLERAILAARNNTVDNLNAQLLATMRGEVFASYNADKIIDQENADNHASEYLNTINLASLPPHLLKLKVGATVILLRNLSPSTRICNGTRLHVVRIRQRVIEYEILAGQHAGIIVFIPRIPLASSSAANLPFDSVPFWRSTKHKNVALCLTEPAFTHGQLYVAICRITDGANLRILVPDTPEARCEGKIKNVIYSKVFS